MNHVPFKYAMEGKMPVSVVRCFLSMLIVGFSSCNYETDDSLERTIYSAPGEPISDAEGNFYSTVYIGNQLWMAENLRSAVYCNGDQIPQIENWDDWANSTSDGWSYYANNPVFNEDYGKLYNWYAVSDSRNICPCGWRVPTEDDWFELTGYLGGDDGSHVVWTDRSGGRMKDTTMVYWEANTNVGATNESGFSARGGGMRFGEDGRFDYGPNIYTNGSTYGGRTGVWWTSTQYIHEELDISYPQASALIIRNYSAESKYHVHPEGVGLSVRCIKE